MSSDQPKSSKPSWWHPSLGWPGSQFEQKPTSVPAIASDGVASRWIAQKERPPFVDHDKARSMRDGAQALQDALDEGFTDFVVIGIRTPENMEWSPHDYHLKVFSRPRPRPVLLHVMQTADNYVTQCLVDNPS